MSLHHPRISSSDGILDSVSVEWLISRLGATKKWSSDALANFLDGALLERIANLWPMLPRIGPQAVVKHRLLLSLLTIRTPIADATLAAARMLVAVALKDGSSTETCTSLTTTTHPASTSASADRDPLVKTTVALVMRLVPSLIPDAGTAEAVGIPSQTTNEMSVEEGGVKTTTTTTNDDDDDNSQQVLTSSSSSSSLSGLVQSALSICDNSVQKVTDDATAALVATPGFSSGKPSSSSSSSHQLLQPATIFSAPLTLEHMPLQSRLLIPAASLIAAYAYPPPPPPPHSVTSAASGIASSTSSSSTSSSSSAFSPTLNRNTLRLSASACKVVADRSTLIQSSLAAVRAQTIVSITTTAAASGASDAGNDEAAAAVFVMNAAAEAENANVLMKKALNAMALFLRGASATAPSSSSGGLGSSMLNRSAVATGGGNAATHIFTPATRAGPSANASATAASALAVSAVGGGGGGWAGGGGSTLQVAAESGVGPVTGVYKVKRERPVALEADDLEAIRSKKRSLLDAVGGGAVVGGSDSGAAEDGGVSGGAKTDGGGGGLGMMEIGGGGEKLLLSALDDTGGTTVSGAKSTVGKSGADRAGDAASESDTEGRSNSSSSRVGKANVRMDGGASIGVGGGGGGGDGAASGARKPCEFSGDTSLLSEENRELIQKFNLYYENDLSYLPHVHPKNVEALRKGEPLHLTPGSLPKITFPVGDKDFNGAMRRVYFELDFEAGKWRQIARGKSVAANVGGGGGGVGGGGGGGAGGGNV